VVLDTEGTEIARHPLGTAAVAEVLRRHGSQMDAQQLPGWEMPVHGCTVADWTAVLTDASRTRAAAQQDFTAADARWRTAIRENVLAGVAVQDVARIVRVTPQRIYQIRDRRR
jgi:hypothetical protein